MKKIKQPSKEIVITKEGSLGILAYGDIAIRHWREVKIKAYKKEKDEKKG